MFIKFFLFWILWRIVGNPFIAIAILLIILYFLDRRYVGITPNLFRPLQQSRKLSKLKQDLAVHPYNTSGKLEAARILMEKKRYTQALVLLEQVQPVMKDSADVLYEWGLCQLMLGDLDEGEEKMLQALEMNPKVKYGEPYLRLGEAWAETDLERAIGYLERFREIHSSSCEAYYRLGQLYKKLDRKEAANRAFRETLDIYRSLPKYKRKTERRWALLAFLQKERVR